MAEISILYKTSIRQYLRINNPPPGIDEEIADKISAAREDLILAGVLPSKANDESDSLIKQAVGLYCKAEFGLDNTDSDKFRAAYETVKARLTLSDAYISAQNT
jgi:hypothetical protein